MNYREPRRWQQRRRVEWIDVGRNGKHPDNEAQRLIEFAGRWAPYGGATGEEILVNFGMTSLRFVERLWQVIPESTCDQEEIRSLASAYPLDRPTNRS
ncbi:hypothetical protein [Rhodococcus opacus]|uniref:hypothetical protein n=1 Tax=Rhodococcus opacus TaxID=37919 RepID=UPI000A98F01B|nr:hypothetical protein [Rhodococcus opacus]